MSEPQSASQAKPLRVAIDAVSSVSALLRVPKLATACYVFAHGAGAGMFNLSRSEPGRMVRIFDGELPLGHKARKAAKPDCDALLLLPAFGSYPNGALLAMGSGSRPSRQRGALSALDATGNVQGPVRTLDLNPLLAPLRDHFVDFNIEGAFVQGDTLSLLQRGNNGSAINARVR